MNSVILCGRLTRDPDVRYSSGDNPMAIARYTLAVDRRFRKDGEQSADFISCICFRKTAEFAEKYLYKGTKMIVRGRLQTGSYTDKEGVKRYTTDVIVDEQEFAESKKVSEGAGGNQPGRQAANTPAPGDDGFMSIPDGLIDEDLPFN